MRSETLQEILEAFGFGEQRLSEGGNPIAPCEAAMIPIVLHEFAATLQDREVIIFIDNTAALFALVKGTSSQSAIARSAHLSGFCCVRNSIRPWFEFVESASNWADSVSRKLADCPFCRRLGIPVKQVQVEGEWWSQPLVTLQKKYLCG